MTSSQGTGSSPGTTPPEQMSPPAFRRLYDDLRARPSWGPTDRRGALNHLTPASVLAAVSSVRAG